LNPKRQERFVKIAVTFGRVPLLPQDAIDDVC